MSPVRPPSGSRLPLQTLEAATPEPAKSPSFESFVFLVSTVTTGGMRSAAVGFIAALVLVCTPLAAGKAGALDTSFDGDGKTTTDFSGLSDAAFAVDAQRDGKLVVVGGTGNDTGS